MQHETKNKNSCLKGEKMNITSITGGIVFFAAVVVVLILMMKSDRIISGVCLCIALTVGMFIFAIGAKEHENEMVMNLLSSSFTKDVDMGKVPVKGYNSFRAEIIITYKDGKLEKIRVADGTTVEATSPRN